MTIRDLKLTSKRIQRDASREYIRERSTARTREITRETDEEIRNVLRASGIIHR
jgi:hypothetical protein